MDKREEKFYEGGRTCNHCGMPCEYDPCEFCNKWEDTTEITFCASLEGTIDDHI